MVDSATIALAKSAQSLLFPWVDSPNNTDGKYHVARKKEDRPIKVELDQIDSYIKQGYGVRMSNKLKEHRPGLFMPKSIDGCKIDGEAVKGLFPHWKVIPWAWSFYPEFRSWRRFHGEFCPFLCSSCCTLRGSGLRRVSTTLRQVFAKFSDDLFFLALLLIN
jgi:hypothetical protein